MHLQFLTDYVQGRYGAALARHAEIKPGLARWRGLAGSRAPDALVTQAWLHLGRPAEAEAHLRRRGRRRIPPELQLRVRHPLRASLDHVTVLPFAEHALAPYLAGVEVTLDGHRLCAAIDTGGAFIVMGTQRAETLGIRLVPQGRRFHGAARADTYCGTARELRLEGATLTNVPVVAISTLRGEQDVVLLGTNVLQQFLSTIDHPGHRLILSPRHEDGEASRHLALLDGRTAVARVPFHLWGDHFMFARGGFGHRHDLNFFLDSGFAYVSPEGQQACVYATAKQCRSWGMPSVRVSGPHFLADEPISLGPLRQDGHLVALAPTARLPWASFGGVRIDGMLSSAFLRRYAWTLDFDRHEYTFRDTAA